MTHEIFTEKLHDLRLFGVKYCSECKLQSPNAIFSPFRKGKCDQCKKEIIWKDGLEKLLPVVMQSEQNIDLLVAHKYQLRLSIPIGVIHEIPYQGKGFFDNCPIENIIGRIGSQDLRQNLEVLANFNQKTISIGIVKTKNTTNILEIPDKVKVILVVSVRNTDYDDFIPAWERTFLHSLSLTKRNELGLAIVFLYTSIELFLTEVCEVILKKQKLDNKFVKSILNRPSINNFQKKILHQVCKSTYNSGHDLWEKFGTKVTTVRRNIVHSKAIDVDKKKLIESAVISFQLIVYILDQLEPNYRIELIKKWNRNYLGGEGWLV